MPMNYSIKELGILLLFWSLGLSLGGYMLFPYLEAEGLGVLEMLVFFAFSSLVPLLMLLPLKKILLSESLFWGFISMAIASLCLGFFGGMVGLSLWVVFSGASFVLFWVPFNGIWFKHGKMARAVHGAAYYGIGLVIGVLAPIGAGLLVAKSEYSTLFYLTGIVFGIGAILSKKLWEKTTTTGNEIKKVNLFQGLNAISGFKTLFLLEAIGMHGFYVILLLITLEYFHTPMEFGMFLGVSTLFAVILSLVSAKISDSKKKRSVFIIITSAGLGASLLFASAVEGLIWWFSAVVIASLFRSLFPPFPIALLSDKKEDIVSAMYGRELVFNFSRTFFLILAIGIYFFFGSLRITLFLSGIAMLIYPLVYAHLKKEKLQILN